MIPTRLVVATHNKKKAGEMLDVLSSLLPETELLTLVDFSGSPEPEETGTTYIENAIIKARSAALFTKEWALADDAGLEVDALEGAPGLYSKRFGGDELPFDQKMALLLGAISEIPDEERTARFRCVVALSPPSGEDIETFEATCEGLISKQPKGSNGFGYDPIFYLPALGRHMAELTAAEKHEISHRGKVLRLMARELSLSSAP